MTHPVRKVLYGVRYDEMYLKKNPPIKPGTKIRTNLSRKVRVPLATSLGCNCKKFAPFMADYLDQPTILNGAKYRFLRKTLQPDRGLLAEFRMFVRRTVRELFQPLKREDVDYEKYLEQSHYTVKQKEKFRDIKKNQHAPPKGITYKSFGKAEFINVCPKFQSETRGLTAVLKNVRCINGPEDRWKVYVAAIIHAVEKRVCSLKYFAKYIPVKDRARVIYERLSSFPGPYYVTDYTSFEASFVGEVLDACEGELYRYMMVDFEEMEDIVAQMIGKHTCKYRGFTVVVPGTRMSGDSNTSLGNGFTNLMLTSFMCDKLGLQFDGFVEGDDGEFCFSGEPEFAIIAKLGFDLKFEPHPTIYTTSFCGLMLSRSLALYSDPVYEIVKFGWTTSLQRHSKNKSVLMGLLRAKALSLFYCHPRCPMITALAVKFIGLTENYEALWTNNFWERTIVEETIKYSSYAREEYSIGISAQDRYDFLQLYGISILVQVAFEDYIAKLTHICELDHWTLDLIITEPYYDWLNSNYVQ